MPNHFEITDDDISAIEERWSKLTFKKYSFDEERRAVIKFLGSGDVQACPGSGKTTTLIAKLLILLDKMPDGQGVCVLSHTNAARDEIVSKLGADANRLLRPPHFVGTIQTFVNQFLGIPGAITRSKSRARKAFYTLPRGTRFAIEQKNKNRAGLEAWHIAARLRYSYKVPQNLVTLEDSEESPLWCHDGTATHQHLASLKKAILEDGCMAFHDAFSLGHEYLKKHPDLATVFAKRFPIVLIDEMQDTDAIQNDLIRQIFDPDKVHVQCFGDRNQSIFNEGSTEGATEWTPTKQLEINSTMRMSPSVARLCEPLALHPQKLHSKSATPDLPHTVFLFDDPQKVLPAYANLLAGQTWGLKTTFWAIGTVGKPKEQADRTTLTSFFPPYKKPASSTARMSSLMQHIHHAKYLIDKQQFCGPARAILIDALSQLLRRQGVRRDSGIFHNAQSLEQHFRQLGEAKHAEFRTMLFQWTDHLVKYIQVKS
jgi:DNA helicase II / ATP-dependent DNA helicase PcrA